MTLKKVVKDEVTMFGQIHGKDSCHNCISLDKTINDKIQKGPEIPIDYKHHSIYDDEIGRKIAEEKNIEEIPYVEHCKIAEDETKKCDIVIGNDSKKFENVGKLREEEFN